MDQYRNVGGLLVFEAMTPHIQRLVACAVVGIGCTMIFIAPSNHYHKPVHIIIIIIIIITIFGAISSLSLLNHAMSPKMNTRNIQKTCSSSHSLRCYGIGTKPKFSNAQAFLVQKQQLRRDVVHMHSLQKSPSHTASSKRNIADIEQGQWWIQAEYRFCDIGTMFHP